MKLTKLAVCAVALLLSTPVWASTNTIWGGFEDTTPGGDHDYNDLVFSITGSGLTLNTSTGQWFAANTVTLGTSGTPFWNNSSSDGPNDNIGFCIYDGCGGHAAQDPGASYLATSPNKGDVNDVFFSLDPGSSVSGQVTISITADNDVLGWELLGGSTINLFHSGVNTFTPGGNFVLIGDVTAGQNHADYSSDGSAQFAFFETPAATPEPSSLMLLGSGLLGMAGVARRRFGRK